MMPRSASTSLPSFSIASLMRSSVFASLAGLSAGLALPIMHLLRHSIRSGWDEGVA